MCLHAYRCSFGPRTSFPTCQLLELWFIQGQGDHFPTNTAQRAVLSEQTSRTREQTTEQPAPEHFSGRRILNSHSRPDVFSQPIKTLAPEHFPAHKESMFSAVLSLTRTQTPTLSGWKYDRGSQPSPFSSCRALSRSTQAYLSSVSPRNRASCSEEKPKRGRGVPGAIFSSGRPRDTHWEACSALGSEGGRGYIGFPLRARVVRVRRLSVEAVVLGGRHGRGF